MGITNAREKQILVFLLGVFLLSPMLLYSQTFPSGRPRLPANTCINLQNNLTLGMSGSEVETLQQFLFGQNLLATDSVTGYYGNLTATAVRNFQTRYGLSSVGRVGPQTRTKIRELTCGGGTGVNITGSTVNPNVPANDPRNYSSFGHTPTQTQTQIGGTVIRPSLQVSAYPESVNDGGSSTISWSSTNASSCRAKNNISGSEGLINTSGTVSVSNIRWARSFTISCSSPTGETISQTVSINVITSSTETNTNPFGGGGGGTGGTDSSNVSAPTLNLTASPTSVSVGGSSVILWASTNASSCRARNNVNGAESSVNLSSSVTVSNIQSNRSYTITCTGPSGLVVTKNVSVAVTGGGTGGDGGTNTGMSINSFTSTPVSTTASTLAWTSTGTTRCDLQTPSGAVVPRNSNDSGTITALGAYALTCYGTSGSVSRVLAVTKHGVTDVLSVSPLSGASPLTVTIQGPPNLMTKIESCIFSGNFFGASGNGLDINWGDGRVEPVMSVTTSNMGQSCSSKVRSHTYNSAGTYTVRAVSWHPGPTDAPETDWEGIATVTVSQGIDPGTSSVDGVSLRVSPLTINKNGSVTITMSAPANYTNCSLREYVPGDMDNTIGGTSSVTGSLITSLVRSLRANAQYTFSCTKPDGTRVSSNTINVAVIDTTPSITASVSPSTINSGERVTVTWSAQNVDNNSCKIMYGGYSASGTLNTSGTLESALPLSGTRSYNPTTKIHYEVSCTQTPAGGSVGTTVYSNRAIVNLNAPATPAPTIPTLTKTAISGTTSTLRWTSTDATSCNLKFPNGTIVSSLGANSTRNVTALGTYTLTCTGVGGNSAPKTISVTAHAPLPTVSIQPSPDPIYPITIGSWVYISWSSTNATACTIQDSATGVLDVVSTSGTKSYNPLSRTTFTVSCSGLGGSAQKATTYEITQPDYGGDG